MANKFTKDYVVNYIERNGGKLSENFKENFEYENQYQKLSFVCCSCGKEYNCSFSKFKNRNKILCNDCSLIEKGKRKRHSYEFIKSEYSKHGYTLNESVYENCEIPMKCINVNGYSGMLSYANLKFGYSFGAFKTSNPFYIQNLNKFSENSGYDCEVLSWEQIGKYLYLKIKCSCGNKFKTMASGFLSQNCYRCRCCSKKESKYSIEVSQFLDNFSVCYSKEKTFDNCRNILKLPFDFCVYVRNKFFLIEVDGQYHYHAITGEKLLRTQKERDAIKTKYCKDNNIDLIRIPYWEFENEKYKDKIMEEINKQNNSEI